VGPLVQSKLVSSKFVVLVVVLADCKALREKFIVYVEGTLYLWISLLEIGSDNIPTPQEWEGSYA
jgi:hypothetical protein